MKRNIVETVLGALVLVIAAAFLLYSTSAAKVGDVDGYTIKASFSEIGGLKQSADVRIGGVKIGTVSDITLDPKTFRAIVSMEILDQVKLPSDSSARIASESLLGGAYLALEPGAEDTNLKAGEMIANTQSATNLEQLLGKFIFSAAEKDKAAPQAASPAPASESIP